MESRVKVAGHPLHQMLIVFPLGLLSTAVVFDILYLVTDRVIWTLAAYYMIGAGVIGGLAAAVPGWLDWSAIPGGTRAKRIGLIHGVGNVIVLGLFSYRRLSIDQYPSVDIPVVTVQTTYPGASAETIEREVTERMEQGA